MKKIISLILVFLMLLPFAVACDDQSSKETQGSETENSSESSSDTQSSTETQSPSESSSDTQNTTETQSPAQTQRPTEPQSPAETQNSTEIQVSTETQMQPETNSSVDTPISPDKMPLYNIGGGSAGDGTDNDVVVFGWGTLVIPSGQRENIIANFSNPSENAGKYYLTFELSLVNSDGTKGERLYKSGLVEPGKYLPMISLSRAFSAGEYAAVLHIQPYRMSDLTPTNNSDHYMKLKVVGSAEPDPDDTGSVGEDIGLVLDPTQGDMIVHPEPEEIPGIAVPGWGKLTIPAGQKDNIIANFNNPDENAGKYYLTFELSLINPDGSKEILYKSGLVEPGKYIQTISLSRALEAGEYEANMFVQPYKMGDLTPTNHLNSKMTLRVIDADGPETDADETLSKDTTFSETSSGGDVGLVVNPGVYDDTLQTETVEGIAIPGWATLRIPAGQKDNIIANFNNPYENSGKYYLQFELSLLNSDGSKGEVLYKSGLVEPGRYIQTISLSRALEAGEYEANMFVQPYKMGDLTPTNNLNSKMLLCVIDVDGSDDETDETFPETDIIDGEVTEEDNVTVLYGLAQAYRGSIPSTIAFGSGLTAAAKVKVEDVVLAGDEQLNVAITSGNNWWLVDKNNASKRVEYSASLPSSEVLTNGANVLSIVPNIGVINPFAPSGEAIITFTNIGTEQGGNYHDMLTFSFSIAKAH